MKTFATLLMCCFVSLASWGQSGISLYHLNNETFQGNNMNPAFIPDGKVFLGLPVLSGVMVDLNATASYNDLQTIDDEGTKVYDFDKIVSQSKDKNYLGVESEISTFYLGFRPKATMAFSVFVRERIAARGFYSHDAADFIWNGNKNYVGKSVDLSTTLVDARYYREYGIGLWKSFPKNKLDVGVRVKFLNGMISAISDSDFDGRIMVSDDNYQHTLSLSHARVNTAGINLIENGNEGDLESHLISNNNLGFGIDVGVNWRINEKFSTSLAINDLGFINWKTDPENYWVADTTFSFDGLNLKDSDNIVDAIKDSLINRLQDSISYESYSSGLNTSAYASGSYHLSRRDMVTATISSHIVQGNFRMLYALGYTRKFGNILSVSGNVIRKPQQGFDVGLATAVNLGALQLYAASDQIIKVWNTPEASSFDIRFGINFIFGRSKVKADAKDNRKDLQHESPYGKGAKVEKSDGLYWIVPKQKPRPVYNDHPEFSDK
ncbi:DUF5723 family protein [Reichenbachiella agarivorans]|uniref:DUF5723 family protein n=1 Tax=Reichenbachiella agarivorans TaxID=2979464 RepID=A0ABY6CTA2_9BACT|nr:DUF5723 family protein [Reichenbachiella agarivorans]UXP33747.1 DUF5723 family protein [Reichenbachiella agarivorans]